MGVGDGVSVAEGDSPGVEVGDAFLRFDLLLGVADGVGEAFFDFGEAVAVGVGVGCFAECLRCLAEVATSTAPNKITRIRSHFIIRGCSVRCPQRRFESSSSAGCHQHSARYSTWKSAGRMPAGPTDVCATIARALAGLLCSNEFRLRNFREENFR